MTRSGSTYTVPRDGNHVPALFGVSTVDGITPIPLEINPSTGALLTYGSSSGASGGLVTVPYDNITYANTSTTVDTYTYKSAGATVATVTITYTDTTKSQISTVQRT